MRTHEQQLEVGFPVTFDPTFATKCTGSTECTVLTIEHTHDAPAAPQQKR